MATREGNTERFENIVLSESATPRWVVVSCFFRWFMEYSSELLELVITELGRSPGTRFVVERGVKAALFEAIRPVVDGLVVQPYLSSIASGESPSKYSRAAVRRLIAFGSASSTSCSRLVLLSNWKSCFRISSCSGLLLEVIEISDREYNHHDFHVSEERVANEDRLETRDGVTSVQSRMGAIMICSMRGKRSQSVRFGWSIHSLFRTYK